MSNFTAYGAYVVFVTVRTHFESKTFDFFKHHKVKASKTTYEKRNDKWFFDKLAKEFTDRDLVDFLISNRLQDRNYVTELFDEDARENYIAYQRRRQSLSYNFTNELDRLFRHGTTRPFVIDDDRYPYIIGLYLRNLISAETMVILNDYVGFFDKFDKHYADDPIWPKIALKLRKYRPFVKYDRNKFKAILKEKVEEYGQTETTEEVSTEE